MREMEVIHALSPDGRYSATAVSKMVTQCCVINIKKEDKLMVQDIGIQLGQHW